MCELLLRQHIDTTHGIIIKVSYDKYHVKLRPCPLGFMFIQMRCQCDPVQMDMLKIVTLTIKLYYEVLIVGYHTVDHYTHTDYQKLVHFNIVTLGLLNFN